MGGDGSENPIDEVVHNMPEVKKYLDDLLDYHLNPAQPEAQPAANAPAASSAASTSSPAAATSLVA